MNCLFAVMQQDAMNIFEKYLSEDATYNLGISDDIRTKIESRGLLGCPATVRQGKEGSDVEGRVYGPESGLTGEAFGEAASWVCEVMERKFFPAFLDSADFAKHQLEVLTSERVHLVDILYAHAALSRFTEVTPYIPRTLCIT